MSTTYRYGREEDEVMGVKFSKEMVLACNQVVPPVKEISDLTAVQKKLVKKFGNTNAFPFVFNFPPNSPSSVTIQPGDDDSGKPLGVEYNIRTYVSDNESDKGNNRSTIVLAIKKVRLIYLNLTHFKYYVIFIKHFLVTIRTIDESSKITEFTDQQRIYIFSWEN